MGFVFNFGYSPWVLSGPNTSVANLKNAVRTDYSEWYLVFDFLVESTKIRLDTKIKLDDFIRRYREKKDDFTYFLPRRRSRETHRC